MIQALRDDMQAGSVPPEEALAACHTMSDVFLNEREPHDGLGARVASVAAQRGFDGIIGRLVNVYRDEGDKARKEALAAPAHAPMMKVIYDAIPGLLAADFLAKMMKELRPEKKYDAISRATDEELVRFSTALGVRCWTMIRPEDARHRRLLKNARAKGHEAVDALIEHWRSGLVFPDTILDRMKAPHS